MEIKETSKDSVIRGEIEAEADTTHCDLCFHVARTRIYKKGKVLDFFNLPAEKQVASHPFYPMSLNICYSCSLDLPKEYTPLLLSYQYEPTTTFLSS